MDERNFSQSSPNHKLQKTVDTTSSASIGARVQFAIGLQVFNLPLDTDSPVLVHLGYSITTRPKHNPLLFDLKGQKQPYVNVVKSNSEPKVYHGPNSRLTLIGTFSS